MKKDVKVYIYKLSHPTTNEIKYIGKTINLSKRYSEHIRPRFYTYKDNWVRSLLKQNLKPVISVIEECTEIDWVERECYWIEHYRVNGAKLCNLSLGGEGPSGTSLSDAHKEAISKANIGVKRSDSFKEAVGNYHRDKVLSDKTKAKMSIAKSKSYTVVTPTNETLQVINLSKYCKDNNLHYSTMHKLVTGKLREYKGYKTTYGKDVNV